MDLRMIDNAKMKSIIAYLIVANDLLPGIKALAPLRIHPRGCTLLAAHSLECILKALSLLKGVNETEIYNATARHNLEVLWRLSFGYNLSTKMPVWVSLLSFMHGRPFYGRYQQDQNNNVVDTGCYPLLIPMVAKLEHAETGLSYCHNILLVSKNGKSMSSKTSC